MRYKLKVTLLILLPLFWRGVGGEAFAQIITTIAGNGTAGYSGDGGGGLATATRIILSEWNKV